MSERHINRVFSLPIDTRDKFILISMASHANDEDICWPGIDRMSSQTGYCQKSVKRSVKRLSDMGLIKIRRTMTHNYYTLFLTGEIEELIKCLQDYQSVNKSHKQESLSHGTPPNTPEYILKDNTSKGISKNKTDKELNPKPIANKIKTAGEIKSPYEDLWINSVKSRYKEWHKELSPKDKWNLCKLSEKNKDYPVAIIIENSIRYWPKL